MISHLLRHAHHLGMPKLVGAEKTCISKPLIPGLPSSPNHVHTEEGAKPSGTC